MNDNTRKITNLIDEIDKAYNTERNSKLIVDALKSCEFGILEYIAKDWLLTEKKPPTIADFTERYRLIDGWNKLLGNGSKF